MKTVEIHIENLKCQGCASTIKKALLMFSEVKEVNVSTEKSTVEVVSSGDEEQIEKYKEKLKSLGYPQVGDSNNTLIQAKSFVSCAIGRISK